jgi:fructokinase
MSLRIGIDLGGTKIELAVLDAANRIAYRTRVATPQGDYAGTLDAIAGLVERAMAWADLAQVSAGETANGREKLALIHAKTPIGIGIPGTESPATGRIKNANSTCLIGQSLRADVEARLQRPVRLANDANCFALSEATDGAAAGAAAGATTGSTMRAGVVFGVILGTGVGGGVVVNGRVLTGANGIAGEWGHNPQPGEREGRACYCGRYDCIETYLSGPALLAEYARETGRSCPDPAQLVQAAAAGDVGNVGDVDSEVVEQVLARYEARLARALAGIVNVLDPDVIVLGGGLSNMARLYPAVQRQWGAAIFSDTVRTVLRQNQHGDSSGVRGAAWLWPDESHAV